MKTIICDLDGTLCDFRHRLHHVTGAIRNWDAFFAGIPDDPPIEPLRHIINRLAMYFKIVLVTGRPEEYRTVTEQWLDANPVHYDELLMRPDDDTRQDAIVKKQILDHLIAEGHDIIMSFDDRQQVVDMLRENGIFTAQCAPPADRYPDSAELILMVGPSGAGKSTMLLSPIPGIGSFSPEQIISSDHIRQDLCGDFRDQSKNAQVFQAVHDIAVARLKNGLTAVIDATHIRRKDRMAAAALAREGVVKYVVVDRPMDQKRRDAGWRGDLPIDLIGKHDHTFHSQLPDILAGDHLPNVTVHDLRVSQ